MKLNSIIKNLSTKIVSLIILSLSFFVLKFQGFAISLSLIFIIYHLFTNPFSINDFNVLFIFVFFFSFNLAYQIWAIDFIEFIKTFFLFCIAVLSFYKLPRRNYWFLDSFALKKIVKITSTLIIAFSLLQLFDFILFGSTKYYFLFDSISISTAKSAERFQAVNLLSYIRPVSFFHEPSFLGSVLLMLFISSIHLQMKKFWIYLIFVAIIITLSMTVYFFTFCYLLYLFKKYIIKIFFLLTLFYFIYIIYFNTGIDYLRLSELTLEGTSGHERIIAPFYSVLYEFNYVKTITGRALGQTKKQLDNSFYVLLSYFGILLPVLLYFIWKHVKNVLSNKHLVNIFMIFFGNLLFLNGAIITPESQFMIFFLFITLKSRTNSIYYNSL